MGSVSEGNIGTAVGECCSEGEKGTTVGECCSEGDTGTSVWEVLVKEMQVLHYGKC
jgi:hypothetical protein